ncbi:MAG: hypothetical protein U5L02_01505 [Rheinheimera sp.]|nr:hypothetical protein [Rheinheimera sp.]
MQDHTGLARICPWFQPIQVKQQYRRSDAGTGFVVGTDPTLADEP